MTTFRVGFKQTEYRIGYVTADTEQEARDIIKSGLCDDSSFDMYDDDCEITFIEDWSDDDEWIEPLRNAQAEADNDYPNDPEE